MSNDISTTPDYKTAKAEAKAAKAFAKAQRPFYKKKRYIGLAAIAGVVTVSVLASGGGSEPKPDYANAASGDAKVETVKVKAAAILKEFEDNEAAADAKYDGKVLTVTGTIDKIDTEFFDDSEYVIQIGGGSDFELWTVNADDQSQDDVASLKKGDRITVTGEFEDGGDLGVELAHAEINN
jgi:hypothetical protein